MAKLLIELEVSESRPGEAEEAVDLMLDEGAIQDAIESFCQDTGREVRVRQASCRYE